VRSDSLYAIFNRPFDRRAKYRRIIDVQPEDETGVNHNPSAVQRINQLVVPADSVLPFADAGNRFSIETFKANKKPWRPPLA
jgi:hypothetical protein